MSDPIRALLVENSADDAELVTDALRQGDLDAHTERVETEKEMRAAILRGGWDIILLDYVLPGFNGSRALRICQEMRCMVPIIIVSGSVGEDVAVAMMKEGADDYVLKDNLIRLPAAVRRAIADAHVRAQRRRTEEELRESREWLDATLRSVGEAVIATDAAGCVCFINRVAENLIGSAETEAAGQDVDAILKFEDVDGNPVPASPSRAVLSNVTGNGRQELVLLGKGRQQIPVIATAARIVNDGDAVIGSVVALRDITERKRTEEQLRQNNRELQQFVHSVSHDLQEPLRMISIYSEMVQRTLVDCSADTKEYLSFVSHGAKRMAALLSDLRTYADVTRSDPLQPEPADAEVALQQVLVNLSVAIDGSCAVVAHDPLPIVFVHSAHLIQLFQNLISNSIKYRRDGHPPTIRIESSRQADQWQFSFADNGSGIAPEYTRRVFDFFQRFHSSEIAGTGMGLAICQRIVQRYGGSIWLESTPGHGSTFHFTLPAVPSGS